MSVKCGNCKDHHDSVADVRSCYEDRARVQTMERKNVVLCPDCREAYQPPAEHRCTLRAERAASIRYGRGGEPLPYPSGRYAILADGVTKFYKVDAPTEGQWAGYVFVKVQASDDLYRIKGEAAQVILREIAKDPQAAMLLYGRELGKCGHCGRTLTDEESRAYGIGPVCRAKVSFY